MFGRGAYNSYRNSGLILATANTPYGLYGNSRVSRYVDPYLEDHDPNSFSVMVWVIASAMSAFLLMSGACCLLACICKLAEARLLTEGKATTVFKVVSCILTLAMIVVYGTMVGFNGSFDFE